MSIRDELIKEIKKLNEEELQAVKDYICLLREPEEIEPTEEDREALALGRAEYERGEYVKWRQIKRNKNV